MMLCDSSVCVVVSMMMRCFDATFYIVLCQIQADLVSTIVAIEPFPKIDLSNFLYEEVNPGCGTLAVLYGVM